MNTERALCWQVLEKAPADANVNLPNISEDDLLRLEQRNKDVAERALASIGKDVSAEAQTIFDALNKTYVSSLLLISPLLSSMRIYHVDIQNGLNRVHLFGMVA